MSATKLKELQEQDEMLQNIRKEATQITVTQHLNFTIVTDSFTKDGYHQAETMERWKFSSWFSTSYVGGK